MKSTDRRNLRLPPGSAEANQAMIDYVSDRSVALILSQPDGVFIGSGTCVMIGRHHLVATAAHNFEDIANDSRVRVVPRGVYDHPGISFLRRSRVADDHDVAWIELEQASAAESGLRFLTLSDLICGQRHDPRIPFLVQGFPSEEVLVINGTAIRPVSLGLVTRSVESDVEIDRLVLEYPPQSAEDHGLDLVVPKGISGGGIWLYPRFQDSPVWSAERTKLVAITRSWIKGKSHLLTEPIERWLRLVASDFPDMHNAIEATLSRG